MSIYQIPCNKNGCHHLNDITKSVCGSCGLPLDGTINMRRATIPSEITALDKRYNDATIFVQTQNLGSELKALESEVINHGKAVINTNLDFLWQWLINQSADYTSYRRQIINRSRPKALYEDDNRRVITDSALFGSEIDIIYAALSTDETGLNSYGGVTIILKTKSIESRTSALETNSYLFLDSARSNGWALFQPLPAGFMAVWPDNFKLAAAKLAKSLKPGISGTEIARLILTSTNDRKTDVFIELFVYGEIVSTVIEKIKIPSALKTSLNAKARLRLNELEKKVKIDYY